MKKIAVLLLTALLAFSPAAGVMPRLVANAAGGFGLTDIQSFTITGSDKMVNTQTTSSPDVVAALEKLLAEAAAPSPSPKAPAETARIRLAYGGGASTELVILAENGFMYVKNGDKLLQISAPDFHQVMNAFGFDLYKYRAIPMISGKWGGEELAPLVTMEGNTYSFKKLDNKYYRPYYEPEAATGAVTAEGAWESLSFTLKPESYTVKVYGTGNLPEFTGTYEKAGEYILKNRDVPHTVKITATYADTENSMYRGEIIYSFAVDKIEKRLPDFEILGGSTNPGEVVVLKVNNYNGSDKISFTSGLNFTPKFFDNGSGGMMALLPVSYLTPVGEQKVTLSCGDKSQSFLIAVKDKQFQIQNMTVDQSTADSTVNSTKANAEYEQYIAPLRPVADDKKYWDGFVWPLIGRVSTEFGMIRYVNGAPTSTRHGAIDLAVAKGTPVKATANGRVLYAGFLQLTGNTVVIEHGYGLKSWYYHMDSLNVKTGDMMKMSQEIGKVGSTGFSTGPHLHFGMSVNNVWINPSTVIDTDLIK